MSMMMPPDQGFAGQPYEQQPGIPSSDSGPSESIEEMLRRHLSEFRAKAEEDGSLSENERLAIEKMMTLKQQFLAGREKEEQAALGGGPQTNFLRRVVSGG